MTRVVFTSREVILCVMRGVHTGIFWQLLGLLICAQALPVGAAMPKQDYNSIKERNVFGLQEPPHAPPPTNPPAQVPKIKLTGITTVTGGARALLQTQVPGAKRGEAGKPEYMILAEGQRDGNIEVLQIDTNAEVVKVNDYGEIMTIGFDKDTTNSPAASATSTAAATRATIPVPKVTPGVGNLGNLRPGYRSMPSRIPRAGAGTTQTASPYAPPSATGAETPYPTLPPAAAASNEAPNATGQTQISPEDELFLEELERSAPPQAPTPTISPVPAPNTLPPSVGALPPGVPTQRTKPPLLPPQ